MMEIKSISPIMLPNGTKLSLADLPSPDTKRWVVSKKELVVLAVEYGLLTKEEACEKYALSNEELEQWLKSYSLQGKKGLRVT